MSNTTKISIKDFSLTPTFNNAHKRTLLERYNEIIEKYKLFNKTKQTYTLENIELENCLDILNEMYGQVDHTFTYYINNQMFVLPKEVVNQDENVPRYGIEFDLYMRNKYLNVDVKTYFKEPAVYSELKSKFEEAFGDKIVDGVFANIDWVFEKKNDVDYINFRELISDSFYREAYPHIEKETGLSIDEFAKDYLSSEEAVFLLTGKPGTGKTRFIRFVMKKFSEMYNKNPSVLYVSNQDTLNKEELFIRFLRGEYDFLVLEDVDESLMPRKDGNHNMSNMLTAADGLIQNLDKKVLITTNLPRIATRKRIDDALLRPGRCYEMIEFDYLKGKDAEDMFDKINQSSYSFSDRTLIEDTLSDDEAYSSNDDRFSLGHIYKIADELVKEEHRNSKLRSA